MSNANEACPETPAEPAHAAANQVGYAKTGHTQPPQETDLVLTRLVDYVVTQKLGVGDRLPSVRELSQRWRIGRNAVRDGLHRAQTLGLLEIHPRSGIVVRLVDYAQFIGALSQTLAVALRQRDPKLVHLWEARSIIEVETSAQAARRRLPEDLYELRLILEETEQTRADRPRFVEADERFHLTIACIAGNPVLQVLLDALLKVLRPDRMNVIPSASNLEKTLATHEAIYEAIAKGDPAAASRIMAEHCQRRARHLVEV